MSFRSVRSFGLVNLVLTLVAFACCEKKDYTSEDPDAYLPTNKIIERHGYPSESHEITTEDGYILTLHRIPHGKTLKERAEVKLPPVFLQHGILCSSADFIMNGPDKSLPYQLSDRGHDVWLGNFRGNTYSRGHVSLLPDNVAFWNFTFHEMGIYDLSRAIDYILEVTEHEKLFYIGHSMGTTTFMVLCSSKPQYNDKIILMIGLAPVAFLTHTKSPIRYFSPYSKEIELFSKWFGDGEFLPRNAVINFILKYGCELYSFEKKICENILFLIAGFDKEQFNTSLIPVIFGHTPAGTSTKTLAHYAQEIMSGKFRQFDYGSKGNEIKYNSAEPPNYNLSQVTVPMCLYYGDNDYLADPLDVKRLAQLLPNLFGIFRVNFHLFNHLDFLWSKDVNFYVNDKVLAIINETEVHGEVPNLSYSFDDLSVDENSEEDPVFNDISSVLKYHL